MALLPESAALVCRTPSPFPTVHAGLTPQVRGLFLAIKSDPGGGGSVVVRGTGVGSTESDRRNNSVAIRLPADPPGSPGGDGDGGDGDGDGGGGGGGGGELPITGAPAATVAGGGAVAVLLGAGLVLATRRRRSC